MIDGLQFLRYIAAAAVVLNHCLGEFEEFQPVGFFGVEIFFVISGFIIYWITDRQPDHFLLRRIIRIVPAYWLFTLAIAFIAYFFPSYLRTVEFDLNHLIHSLFFIPLWTEATGWSPLLKLGWTLNLEMMFYLIFFTAMRINHQYRGEICIAVAILVSILAVGWTSEGRSHFYMTTHWLVFAYGIGLGIFYEHIKRFNKKGYCIFLAISCFSGLFFIDLFTFPEQQRFLYFGILSALFVASILSVESKIKKLPFFLLRLIRLGGDISYPCYLIHIFVIAILNRLLHLELNIFLFTGMVLILTSGISIIFNRWFDYPIRTKLWRLSGL